MKPVWQSGGGLERGERNDSLGASTGAGGQAQLVLDAAQHDGLEAAHEGQIMLGSSEARPLAGHS